MFTARNGEQTIFPGAKVSPFNGYYVFPLLFDKSSGGTTLSGTIFLGTEGNGLADLQHEYGHYLDALNMGSLKYIKNVALPSLSTANDPNHLHESYEVRATNRAIKYFGPNSAIASNKFYPR